MTRKLIKPFNGRITTPSAPWLASESEETSDRPQIDRQIPLSNLHLAARQPRRYFDDTTLQNLAASIAEHGILQPLLVRTRAEGGYEIVAGERRYRAAKILKLEKVPVIICALDNHQAWQVALIENLQREDLTAIDETEGILDLLALELEQPLEDIPYLLRSLFHYKTRQQKLQELSENVSGDISKETPKALSQQITDSLSSQNSDNNAAGNNVITSSRDHKKNLSKNISDSLNLEKQKNNAGNNVITNDPNDEDATDQRSELLIQKLEKIFEQLGRMSWESFVANRLPLISMPEHLIQALRDSRLEYTKVRLIATVKDEEIQKQLLEEAIAKGLSLTSVRGRVGNYVQTVNKARQSLNPASLRSRFYKTIQAVKNPLTWTDKKRRPRLEALLKELEELLREE